MVNKKECLLVFSILFGFYLMSFINAGVYFSQQDSTYNLGDVIDLNMTIDPIVDGPFKLKLNCDGKTLDIFSGPAIENLVLPLNELWIGDSRGNCYFYSEYGGEISRTNPSFVISNKLNVVLDTEEFFAKPDETITITGNVSRLNGLAEEGEVEILTPFKGVITFEDETAESTTNVSLDSNETNNNETANSTEENIENETTQIDISDLDESKNIGKVYGKVSEGIFSVSLKLPSDSPPGEYVLVVNAFDKTLSGKRVNQGSVQGKLKVPQILKGIDVAINNKLLDPGDNLTIKPSLVDQAGQVMSDSSFVSIINSDNEALFEQVVIAGDTATYNIPTDLESAYYSIDVSSGEKIVTKNFFVSEKARVFFEVKNDTLYIKNIGNVRYNKEITVDINGQPFVKMIDLEVGESKELYLTGNGTSTVSASDGENSIQKDNVALTGHAIDVKDFRSVELGNLLSNPLLWIFIIILILVALTIIMNKVIKRRSIAKPREYHGSHRNLSLDSVMKREVKEEPKKEPVVLKKRVSMVPMVPPTHAIPGMVTGGHRNVASFVVLKIKNKITPFAKDFIQKSINGIYSRKGAVYEHNEYVIGVFSPMATKSFKNEVDASKAAEDICNFLLDYNKKFKEPIEFGIGVNSGEIINEIRDGKLLFTALGSGIVIAKKLAEYSKDEVLLSEAVYHKGMSEVQADRKNFGDLIGFRMKKIVDYEKNKKFIDAFLKRAEKDSGVKYVRKDGYLSRNRVGDGLPTANTLLRDANKSSEINVSDRSTDNSTSTNYVDFR